MSAEQMMLEEIAKRQSPRPRRKRAIAIGAGVAVLLTVGGVAGANAAIGYRDDIRAMQTQIAEDRAAADELNASTIALAAEAQQSAVDAQTAVDSLVAAEEAAAAQAAAIAAETAAAQAASTADPNRCPAGTSANSGDGGRDTSCLPNICFGLTLPDPSHPECDYAHPPIYYY